ncbi:MAG: GNAT family N-acetyltransferase [Alphaproteobacteria bacterium]|nr:GNAT family N-acetyltransferase [Alphaproteobacteria bacterium]
MAPAKGIFVRHATIDDCDAIAEVHLDSIRSLGAAVYDADVIDAWGAPRSGDTYRRAMDNGEEFFIAIAHEAGKEDCIIGISSYRCDAGKHRTAIYVRGDAARMGVGSALLAAAESAAQRHGASSIDVDASLASVAFYKANGFQELGRGEHKLATGQRMACIFMRKQL